MIEVKPLLYSIAAAEHACGVSKETLRKWEDRYGFPRPVRAAHGERLYSEEDIEQLCLIKQLLNTGKRPSQVVPLSPESRRSVKVVVQSDTKTPEPDPQVQCVLELVGRNDPDGLSAKLKQLLVHQGLSDFIVHTFAPLNLAVGRAWEEGILTVFQEHLYTGVISQLMHDAIASLDNPSHGKTVLLTTAPAEQHSLGMMMVHGLFALAGWRCVTLGPQTPLDEMVQATQQLQVQVLALSFSASFARNRVRPTLAYLSTNTPQSVQIWAGGAGVASVRLRLPRVTLFSDIAVVRAALQRKG